jgi:alpha-galactosidase
MATLLSSRAHGKIVVTPDEMAQKNIWMQQNLLTPTNLPPFSFVYHSQPSSTLLPAWTRVETDIILDTNRTQHVLTWTNAGIGLQVRSVVTEYNDYPEVEWTVFLTNAGVINTPVVQNIQGLDVIFSRTNGPEYVLNGNQGDFTTADSYEPFQITLGPNVVKSFAPPESGKSSDGPNGWPYYNLQMPGGGAILAIGWPGQWASSFSRDTANNLRVQAGQELTSMYLKPGEEIRTPMIALFFWQGTNVVRAQNLWRHFYLAHIIPKGTSPLESVGGDNINVVNSYLQAGIKPDALWQDAGWYPDTNGPYTGSSSWINTGTWEPDPAKYPAGFKSLTDQLHSLGTKFILWFEPERVGDTNSWLGVNHPEWLLLPGSVGLILNEGNPLAFNWLTNHFDGLIKSNGVDWYREDMNGGGPCSSWRNTDVSNRKGITENFYVQNHLAYWDDLIAMNPGLKIDSCASGGRRNDFETMHRAVPLTRSDFQSPTMPNLVNGNQCHTYALSSWLPFQGSGPYLLDVYSFRSFYLPGFVIPFGLSPDNIATQQQAYAECKKIAPIMLYGDYYPLTPYSLADTNWMAWQFDRPDMGEGCIQVFRRTNNLVGSMSFQLQGLAPGLLYELRDFDKGDLGTYTGNELMSTGLTIQLNPQQSAIIYYTNIQNIELSAAGSPTIGFKPLVVQFAATGVSSSGSALSYAWIFGDGGTSTNQNPSYAYSNGGRYTAQVTASDGQGNTNAMQIPITVMGETGQRMKTTFSGYTRTESLSNFPALLVFGTNLSANGFSYGQVASSNGWDLMFMNSDETQPLNYEIEKWNTNGGSFVWVQVPQLASNTWIWACWGDTNLASTPAPSATNGSVWANGYAGVWHLANGVVLSGTDSTAGVNNGVINNAAATNGVIDGAALFNGANAYMDLGTAANPVANQQLTMSAWVFPKGGTVIMMKGSDAISDSYGLEWLGNTTLLFTFGSTTDWLSDGGSTPPNEWSHITGAINGNNKYLYVNGLLKASDTFSGTLSTSALSLWLGAQNRPSYNYWFNGTLDEVRMSSLARSANWVWAEYQNMSSNSIFNSYGLVNLYASSNSSVHLSISGNRNNVVISWPTNIVAGAVLQTSQDLLTWKNTTDPVVISGTNNTINITPQYTVEYYRLTY